MAAGGFTHPFRAFTPCGILLREEFGEDDMGILPSSCSQQEVASFIWRTGLAEACAVARGDKIGDGGSWVSPERGSFFLAEKGQKKTFAFWTFGGDGSPGPIYDLKTNRYRQPVDDGQFYTGPWGVVCSAKKGEAEPSLFCRS